MKNKNLKTILILIIAITFAALSSHYAVEMLRRYQLIPALPPAEVKTENVSAEVATKKENQLEFVIEIKENKFVPDVLEVPAHKDFKLVVRNQDKTIEEFESTELKKEKLVKGGKEIVLNISALKAGEYKFFGEFHPKTAQGKIIVKNFLLER
jgi:plastocyanin